MAVLLVSVTFAGCTSSPAPADPADALDGSTISWTPTFPVPGQVTSFVASVTSSIPGDKIVHMSWTIGSTTYDEARPVHVFSQSGDVDVWLTVQTEGAETTLRDTVQVLEPGAPTPTAAPKPPTTGPAPETQDAPVMYFQIDQNRVTFGFDFAGVAEGVHWDFGDDSSSAEPAPSHTYAATGTYSVVLRVLSASATFQVDAELTITSVPFRPHVIVAVPDSGTNPYHEVFYRAELTAHPCTYIEDFPCSVQELPLSVGQGLSYSQALAKDDALWKAMKPGQWYWIPQTVFVGFGCEGGDFDQGLCGLDDGDTHGTGTTGSVITEAPEALLVFKEGGPDIAPFERAGFPVDIHSVSWGWVVPVVGTFSFPTPACGDHSPLYVKSSGNEPGLSSLPDCWTSHPDVMSVGGAYAQDNSQYIASGKEPDFVSYYCRPAARAGATTGTSTWCGTSFAAPTAAGAIAKTVLAIRQASGYTGTLQDDMVDPIAGVSVGDLREALRMTASYSPAARYSNTDLLAVPLNPLMPCVQWSWGFLDAGVADATIAHLTGGAQGSKDALCDTYMRTIEQVKRTIHT